MQKRLGLDLQVPDDFGHFLAGFSAGEACFWAGIRRNRTGYQRRLDLKYHITLRADDVAALEYIQSMLGIGRIQAYKPRQRDNPAVYYAVSRIGDLYHVIVPLFEKYPISPRFKKAKDFKIWKRIVEIHYHEGRPRALGSGPGRKGLGCAPLPQSYWDKIEPLVEELKSGRRFRP